jgi:glucose-6-phosphate isomerase
VPSVTKGLRELDYLSGLPFETIMRAEYQGTAQALSQHGRPNATLFLPKICPESLGALFHFFLCAAAYFGELLGVNTYNQPGVEASKQLTREILQKTKKAHHAP